MKDPRIPLYLITGFLDSGKTTLLTDTLNMDYFADGQRTVLLMCEDGETEYDPEQLSRRNTRLVPVQDQAQLNTSFLQEIDRRYQPERVLLEYNGMWPIQILRDLKLPKTWGLYQAIDVIDGSTFEMYRSNMQSMVIDMVTEADMVLFNRCTPDMPLSGWKRSIRAVNRMCEIVFEDEKGEELEVEDILPYSLEADHHRPGGRGLRHLVLGHPGAPRALHRQDRGLPGPGHDQHEAAQGHLHPRPQRHDLLRRGHPLLRLPVQV